VIISCNNSGRGKFSLSANWKAYQTTNSERRRTLQAGTHGSPSQNRSTDRAAVSHRTGLCQRAEQHRGRGKVLGDDPDRGQVAGTVPERSLGGYGGRTSLGSASQDHPPRGGGSDHPDSGDSSQERHPLEYPDHRRGQRVQPKCHRPDLAGVRAEGPLD